MPPSKSEIGSAASHTPKLVVTLTAYSYGNTAAYNGQRFTTGTCGESGFIAGASPIPPAASCIAADWKEDTIRKASLFEYNQSRSIRRKLNDSVTGRCIL